MNQINRTNKYSHKEVTEVSRKYTQVSSNMDYSESKWSSTTIPLCQVNEGHIVHGGNMINDYRKDLEEEEKERIESKRKIREDEEKKNKEQEEKVIKQEKERKQNAEYITQTTIHRTSNIKDVPIMSVAKSYLNNNKLDSHNKNEDLLDSRQCKKSQVIYKAIPSNNSHNNSHYNSQIPTQNLCDKYIPSSLAIDISNDSNNYQSSSGKKSELPSLTNFHSQQTHKINMNNSHQISRRNCMHTGRKRNFTESQQIPYFDGYDKYVELQADNTSLAYENKRLMKEMDIKQIRFNKELAQEKLKNRNLEEKLRKKEEVEYRETKEENLFLINQIHEMNEKVVKMYEELQDWKKKTKIDSKLDAHIEKFNIQHVATELSQPKIVSTQSQIVSSLNSIEIISQIPDTIVHTNCNRNSTGKKTSVNESIIEVENDDSPTISINPKDPIVENISMSGDAKTEHIEVIEPKTNKDDDKIPINILNNIENKKQETNHKFESNKTDSKKLYTNTNFLNNISSNNYARDSKTAPSGSILNNDHNKDSQSKKLINNQDDTKNPSNSTNLENKVSEQSVNQASHNTNTLINFEKNKENNSVTSIQPNNTANSTVSNNIFVNNNNNLIPLTSNINHGSSNMLQNNLVNNNFQSNNNPQTNQSSQTSVNSNMTLATANNIFVNSTNNTINQSNINTNQPPQPPTTTQLPQTFNPFKNISQQGVPISTVTQTIIKNPTPKALINNNTSPSTINNNLQTNNPFLNIKPSTSTVNLFSTNPNAQNNIFTSAAGGIATNYTTKNQVLYNPSNSEINNKSSFVPFINKLNSNNNNFSSVNNYQDAEMHVDKEEPKSGSHVFKSVENNGIKFGNNMNVFAQNNLQVGNNPFLNSNQNNSGFSNAFKINSNNLNNNNTNTYLNPQPFQDRNINNNLNINNFNNTNSSIPHSSNIVNININPFNNKNSSNPYLSSNNSNATTNNLFSNNRSGPGVLGGGVDSNAAPFNANQQTYQAQPLANNPFLPNSNKNTNNTEESSLFAINQPGRKKTTKY